MIHPPYLRDQKHPRYVVVTLEAVHQLTQVAGQIDFEARAMLPNTHTLLKSRKPQLNSGKREVFWVGKRRGTPQRKHRTVTENMVTICHNKSISDI